VFAAKLGPADAVRLEAILAGSSFGSWVRSQLAAEEAEARRAAD
jgi:alpha/beta superfamily hydrolase